MEQKTIGSGQTAKNRMPKTNSLFNGAHSFSDPDHRNNSLASLAPPKRHHAAAVERTVRAAPYAPLAGVRRPIFFESAEKRCCRNNMRT
jgi:hypothetical protein